jgi:hypothetical protein
MTTTLDLDTLDSVTGGCRKSHPDKLPASKPLQATNNLAGAAPSLAPLAPSPTSASGDDPMQTLAMLGLGVLDLIDKGELDPNLLISGIDDAFGVSHDGGGALDGTTGSTDLVHSAEGGVHTVDQGDMVHTVETGWHAPATGDVRDHRGDNVHDHRVDAQSQSADQQPHTPYTGAGTWHMFSK